MFVSQHPKDIIYLHPEGEHLHLNLIPLQNTPWETAWAEISEIDAR